MVVFIEFADCVTRTTFIEMAREILSERMRRMLEWLDAARRPRCHREIILFVPILSVLFYTRLLNGSRGSNIFDLYR